MIKVCHMTSSHLPGDGRIFQKECTSLAGAGYDVYLVERGDSYEENGVHILGIGMLGSGRIKRMLVVSRKVYQKAAEVDADIYHFHDPELLPYALKLKRKGKRVIFDSHENYKEQFRIKPYLPAWLGRMISAVYAGYERHVLKQLDAVIYPCLKDGRHPFEGMCRRAVTIDNSAMLAELYEHYDAAAEKYPRSVCYIGSLTYNRGVTHLIKAAAAADCTVYLGGTFPLADYQRETMEMPEFLHVKYLGPLNRSQVLDTLQHCQIGMANLLNVGQYNQYDNLPTKVYEYMSLGIPVILTRAPYNERMIQQHQFGICVDPENTEEIAAAMTYLLDHPEEARRMGENGRRAVREVFNWGVEEKKLLALYEDILKN